MQPANRSATPPPSQPRPAWRAVARLGWFLAAALVLIVLIALAPIHLATIRFDWRVEAAFPSLPPGVTPAAFARYILVLRYAVTVIFLGAAGLIFWRRPDNGLALLASLTLLTLPLTFNQAGYTETWYLYPPPWPIFFRTARAALTGLVAIPGLTALLFLFPDGRFAGRWARRLGLGLGATVLLFGAWTTVSQAAGWRDPAGLTWGLWVVTLITTLAVGLVVQVHHYRRLALPFQRQQTRLVVLALAGFVVIALLMLAAEIVLPRAFYAQLQLVSLHLSLASLAFIPLSLAVSILRYRLWDIELIVNRALVYSGLTLLILALYVAVVGLSGQLAHSASDVTLSILLTGLAALLFNPLRERLQRAANRLMYGERDDPATALARLGRRLEAAAIPSAVLPSITESVAQALKLPYVAVELVVDGRPWVVEHGQPPAQANDLARLPIVYQAEPVGQLLVAARARGELLTPGDWRLLQAIARQAGPALHAVRLSADLQRSRERLVTAREEERRRLRRDLHDGLGPTLASQTFTLDTILDLLRSDPEQARRLLLDVKAQTQATVGDIRRLVYDLRPPALDELGLIEALSQAVRRQAGGGLQLLFDAPAADLPPLSAAVEAAAYRIALEAVTNVVRHAQARECRVQLDLTEAGMLSLEVLDDGCGLPPAARPGVGLASMRERAAELGGTCRIEPRPEGGTRVSIRLPLGG